VYQGNEIFGIICPFWHVTQLHTHSLRAATRHLGFNFKPLGSRLTAQLKVWHMAQFSEAQFSEGCSMKVWQMAQISEAQFSEAQFSEE